MRWFVFVFLLLMCVSFHVFGESVTIDGVEYEATPDEKGWLHVDRFVKPGEYVPLPKEWEHDFAWRMTNWNGPIRTIILLNNDKQICISLLPAT